MATCSSMALSPPPFSGAWSTPKLTHVHVIFWPRPPAAAPPPPANTVLQLSYTFSGPGVLQLTPGTATAVLALVAVRRERPFPPQPRPAPSAVNSAAFPPHSSAFQVLLLLRFCGPRPSPLPPSSPPSPFQPPPRSQQQAGFGSNAVNAVVKYSLSSSLLISAGQPLNSATLQASIARVLVRATSRIRSRRRCSTTTDAYAWVGRVRRRGVGLDLTHLRSLLPSPSPRRGSNRPPWRCPSSGRRMDAGSTRQVRAAPAACSSKERT